VVCHACVSKKSSSAFDNDDSKAVVVDLVVVQVRLLPLADGHIETKEVGKANDDPATQRVATKSHNRDDTVDKDFLLGIVYKQ